MKKIQEKQQLQQVQHKPCFGTKEWSRTSGICRGCKLKAECGKIKNGKG